jgi:hypothetical protein
MIDWFLFNVISDPIHFLPSLSPFLIASSVFSHVYSLPLSRCATAGGQSVPGDTISSVALMHTFEESKEAIKNGLKEGRKWIGSDMFALQ